MRRYAMGRPAMQVYANAGVWSPMGLGYLLCDTDRQLLLQPG